MINRGLAYYIKKEYSRAISDYTEALKLDPTNVGALRNRALAYRAKGDYDHEIAELQ